MSKKNKVSIEKLRRVAFICDGDYGNNNRIAMGICNRANPLHGSICRGFSFENLVDSLNQGTTKLPPELVEWCPDAIIYSGTDVVIDLFEPLRQNGVEVVATVRLPRTDFPIVLSDIMQNFALAHDHLAGRVAAMAFFITGIPHSYGSALEKYRIFTEYRGVPCSYYEYGFTGTLEEIRCLDTFDPAFIKWLRQLPKPLGLYSNTFQMGLFLWRCCHSVGLRVPEDVMIIGIDDFDVANESVPPITSIRLPFEAMGERAVDIACERLDGKLDRVFPEYVSGSTLIGRRSTRAELSQEWDLDAALAFIEKYACEGVNVDDVFTHTQSVARSTFHRRFLESTGITPRRALEARRMREVRRLLVETEMSPSWIAGMCGYPDYIHFYKSFRQINGLNPTDYRVASG